VWDVNSPESPIKLSPIVVESHEDPVLSVDWVYDPSAAGYVVASLGADGKVTHPPLLPLLLHLASFPSLTWPSVTALES
jgi:WD40 repeat protein